MRTPDRRNVLLLAGAASIAAWAIPILSFVALPLVYLNTHVHELCHALAAVFSGGTAQKIVVLGSGSGYTPVAGGSLLLVGSAGYVGASLIGAGLILFGTTPRGASNGLLGLALMLGLSMLLWVRGDAIGLASGVGWIVLLVLLSAKLQGAQAVFAAQFLGMQQCLMSVQALLVLLRINAIPGVQNDAKLLADHTPLPAMFWAICWFGVSLLAMGAALRSAWSGGPSSQRG